MVYTDEEIKFLHKCLKYFKKYNKSITHDHEGILWFPQRELGIKKDRFLEMCVSIFNKAENENLTHEEDYGWTWECFDIVIIDTKLTIAKLVDNHYGISFKSL